MFWSYMSPSWMTLTRASQLPDLGNVLAAITFKISIYIK